MTKKRKRYPDLNQKLERPWCYYCERDFDDLKILISHQKAKHFKCDRCGRRLNTAGGLNVHMTQVHKENLTHVENANPGRGGLDIEIFGMEGVPQEIVDQHNQEVTHRHFEEEQERARVTGNPVRGLLANGGSQPNKRPKVNETLDDIKARAEKFREDKANGIIPAGGPVQEPPKKASPPAATGFAAPPGAAAPFPPAGVPFPSGGPPPFGVPPPLGLSQSPQNGGLPQRPPFGAPAHDPASISASVDDLIASATGQAPPAEAPAPEKKGKKAKDIKLVFFDDKFSPEEKMAGLARYADSVRT